MPRSEDKNVPYKRLVLGFDGGCSVCEELARRIGEELGDRIGVINLDDPRAVEWREKALGENIPWGPTLFEVDSHEVRAWTGKQIALKLSLSLDPADTWRVMQALGEMDNGEGMSRRRFLRAVGGAVVAVGALSGAGGLASPAVAQSNSNTQSTIVQVARTRNEMVGASIAHPKSQTPEREDYTFDETYGFTLLEPDPSDDHHGGEPVVRVALAYGLKPGQIQSRVQERISEHDDLSLKTQALPVGEKRYRGTAVGPIPGSTPSTEVYVLVEGRVYQINVYEPSLSAEGRRLLSSLRFERPSRSADSLRKLPNGKKAETYQRGVDEELVEREQEARKKANRSSGVSSDGRGLALPAEEGPGLITDDLSASVPGLAEYDTLEATPGGAQTTNLAVPSYNEYRTSEGCWVAQSTYFFQTQHGYGANGGASDGLPTGYVLVGYPNYWGQYTHGSLGYGRCVSTYYTNDRYAVDYKMNTGDVVFSPFSSGTVLFAGRNYTHKDYGIFVVIRADNGKYVNLSAHLSRLNYGIYRGARVYASTVIGFAGGTTYGSIPTGYPHLHQTYYRYPSLRTDGSPYGGAGLQVVYHRYSGVGRRVPPGVYTFGPARRTGVVAKGSYIGN